MVDSFRLPETVAGAERIGKEPSIISTAVVELKSSHPVLPLSTGTQDSTSADGPPLEEALADTTADTLPLEPCV